ncbi:hypothetical protein BHYA_0456g00040 [Botrytis hyacinthi]|uniref:Uncharacterized protein n=1 Tax=Botrytis hyacinthi TaxID=278943 RepID=A0A4Z1GBR2_9HELO|nr:hypothetical protein BHYA_0456g00040 [Botrytis hyacinthi]
MYIQHPPPRSSYDILELTQLYSVIPFFLLCDDYDYDHSTSGPYRNKAQSTTMSNEPEKGDSPFQPLPPLPQLPECGILLPESSPPDTIGRPFPTSYVRGGPSVADDRSPASGVDAPSMVVSDRAEPDRGRSASGLLRVGGSLRGHPPNPYDMNRYNAIHNNARTFYPDNAGTTMNNGPASNLPLHISGFVNGARGHSPYRTLRPPPFGQRPFSVTDQPDPSSAALRRQLIASPAPTTASATVRATRMTPAPVTAYPIAPAVPVSSSTRSRTQKQTSTAIKKKVKKPAAKRATAKKPATKKSTAKRPSKDRSSFCIPRIKITEVELASIRAGYGTLLARKNAFKNAPPGAYANIEITFGEKQRLCSIRDNGAEERQAYYDNPKPEEIKEAMLKASASYEKTFEKQRARARGKGYPDAMPLADRFPVVALAVAPVVAANAADSTEDQEMADDDSVSSESSFYGESEDEDMEEE